MRIRLTAENYELKKAERGRGGALRREWKSNTFPNGKKRGKFGGRGGVSRLH